MEGVLPFARSEDTLGLYTHTAADMIALWKALGHPEGSEEQFSFGAPEPIPECEPKMADAFRQSLSLLRRAGVVITTIDLSAMLKKLDAANDLLPAYNGPRLHQSP